MIEYFDAFNVLLIKIFDHITENSTVSQDSLIQPLLGAGCKRKQLLIHKAAALVPGFLCTYIFE